MSLSKLIPVSPMTFDKGTPPCSETSPDAFFPEEIEDENGKRIGSSYPLEAEAKQVCSTCPYRLDCLMTALANNEMGIWGGTTENERSKIRRYQTNPATYQIRTRKGATNGQKSRFL